MDLSYDGLGSNMGNLSRLSNAFGLYRWHIADPIRFKQDLRVTIQALGWRDWPRGFDTGPRYLPLQDDIASTVFWYQAEPHGKYPTLPCVNDLDVN